MLQTASLKKESTYTSVVVGIIAINHLIGVAGLNLPASSAIFQSVSWVNLLLSLILVTAFHKPVNLKFAAFCSIAFLVGMGAEITGVNTGKPFGIYYYTPLFGWQIAGVPIIIGLNWVLLGYVCASTVGLLIQPGWKSILAASFLMVVVDVMLEPFAIRHTFWVWQNVWPGLENYGAWFVVALPIQMAYNLLIKKTDNMVGVAYLLILMLFLVADWLLGL